MCFCWNGNLAGSKIHCVAVRDTIERSSMEVRKGYKQTEVGVIPEDWEVKKLGSQCQIFGRIGFRGYTINDIVKEDQGAISLSPSNIVDGKLNLNKVTFLSWFKYEESPEIKINNGDILLVKTGSTYGKTAIVKGLFQKATLNPQIVVLKKIICDNAFLGYMMNYPIIKEQIEASIVGGAIPTLSQEQVSKFAIPLPPTIEEQRAIAGALSDVDELISRLETLITKKKAIKQGAMQELLTGKTRLKGFESTGKTKPTELGPIPEDWEILSYEDIFSFLSTSTFSRAELKEDAEVMCVHYGDIHTKFNHFIDFTNSQMNGCELKTASKYSFIKNGDLIMADASEDYEGIGKSVEVKGLQKNAISGLHTVLLRDKNDFFVNGFRGYLQSIKSVKVSLEKYATGLKVFGVTKTNLKKIRLPIPPKEEQKAIAQILSEMDQEIEQLETKKAKYQTIKQGMMQELLTGKTRLV